MSLSDTIVLIAGIVVISGLVVLGIVLKRRANASRRPAAPGSRRAAQEAPKPSFGNFGAVTSNISIIPDVEKGGHDGGRPGTGDRTRRTPRDGDDPRAS